ncbi:basic proline-rich protein-like [Penaeus monodon]|uniref:basic proline-rich protein-like n=1 Tax=Penaeus monodon TaxID=6687 RepID=UPI0018A78CDE|nr:basic proline-rich protein-like [Penaeus monodon]
MVLTRMALNDWDSQTSSTILALSFKYDLDGYWRKCGPGKCQLIPGFASHVSLPCDASATEVSTPEWTRWRYAFLACRINELPGSNGKTEEPSQERSGHEVNNAQPFTHAQTLSADLKSMEVSAFPKSQLGTRLIRVAVSKPMINVLSSRINFNVSALFPTLLQAAVAAVVAAAATEGFRDRPTRHAHTDALALRGDVAVLESSDRIRRSPFIPRAQPRSRSRRPSRSRPSYGRPRRPSKGQRRPQKSRPSKGHRRPRPSKGRPRPSYGAPPKAPSPSYGAPPKAPSPSYGAPPKAPSPSYGAPPKAPSPSYGAPPKAPSPSYGAPPKAPSPSYGAPPKAPSPSYGAPPKAPSPSYGAPPKAPSPSYGAPPKAPSPSYGAPPKAPSPSYGAPPKAPSPSYGAPPKAPSPSYGAPPKAPSSSYGAPS